MGFMFLSSPRVNVARVLILPLASNSARVIQIAAPIKAPVESGAETQTTPTPLIELAPSRQLHETRPSRGKA
jgi:hypothetical protein